MSDRPGSDWWAHAIAAVHAELPAFPRQDHVPRDFQAASL